MPIHGGRDRELVPAQDRAPGQGHFLDRRLAAVGADERGVPVHENELVAAPQVQHRPQQPPRVDPNPALMLFVMTQHDTDPHVALLPMKA